MPCFGRLAAGGTLIACLAASPLAAQGAAAPRANDTRARNMSAYVALLRSDIREQKVALISGMMQFSEADDQVFWPVYREYEGELSAINDERLALIKEYAQAFEKMTDPIADRLAHAVLDLEARRHALKTKYYERLAAVLPARTAARVLQVENQILLLLDLQIAASLPVIE
jgi:hypothetical protein